MVTTVYYGNHLAPVMTVDANNNPGNRNSYDGFGRLVKIDEIDPEKCYDDAGYGTTLKAFEYNYRDRPKISLRTPNGGGTYIIGSTVLLHWYTAPEIATGGVYPYYSTDGGTTWNPCDPNMEDPIGFNDEDFGRYAWTTPAVLSSDCMIKIELVDSNYHLVASDVSDATFTIRTPF